MKFNWHNPIETLSDFGETAPEAVFLLYINLIVHWNGQTYRFLPSPSAE